MAKIICISNSKGGVGKTTIALNLYARLTASGGRCAIIDADPQQSITRMNELRQGAGINLVPGIDAAGPVDFILVDTPPYRKETDPFLSAAHLVLIPCTPSPLDVSASMGIIHAAGAKGFVLLNRVSLASSIGQEVRAALEQAGAKVLGAFLSNRVAFARSGLVDLVDDIDEKAGIELNAVAVELLILLTNEQKA